MPIEPLPQLPEFSADPSVPSDDTVSPLNLLIRAINAVILVVNAQSALLAELTDSDVDELGRRNEGRIR